jgi:acylphosphatase
MSDVIRHVVIHGVVQGVGFRYWTEDAAHRHGVGGWVRNRRDGTVEAVFAGSANAVAAMIVDCGHGPSSARVSRIDEREGTEQDLNLRGVGEKFSSLPTI